MGKEVPLLKFQYMILMGWSWAIAIYIQAESSMDMDQYQIIPKKKKKNLHKYFTTYLNYILLVEHVGMHAACN